MLRDFCGVTGNCSISQLLPGPLQQGITQHLQQAILPVLNLTRDHQIFLLQIGFVVANRRRQFRNACALAPDGLHNWWSPVIAARSQRL